MRILLIALIGCGGTKGALPDRFHGACETESRAASIQTGKLPLVASLLPPVRAV